MKGVNASLHLLQWYLCWFPSAIASLLLWFLTTTISPCGPISAKTQTLASTFLQVTYWNCAACGCVAFAHCSVSFSVAAGKKNKLNDLFLALCTSPQTDPLLQYNSRKPSDWIVAYDMCNNSVRYPQIKTNKLWTTSHTVGGWRQPKPKIKLFMVNAETA